MKQSKINFALNAGGKRKTAFTLAEVLITLTIIGIIAAATIPTLMQKHLETEMVTKLKKNFSVLNSAYAQAIRENGNPTEWTLGKKYTGESTENFYNYIKPYLKVSKECAHESGCFSTNYKPLFGNLAAWPSMDSSTTRYKFILEDGTAVSISTVHNTGCAERTDNPYLKVICAQAHIDLNGIKGPNRVGIDGFSIIFTDKNVVPTGLGSSRLTTDSGNECTHNEQNNSTNGATCGVHALYKGNMDYLHHDIRDEWQ